MKLKRLKSFFQNNWPWLSYLSLFIISFIIFAYLQYSPTFADPDSFYHTKMALLIKEHGVVRDFPWLQFTVLKDNYTDQHFLYHVLLIPFVSFLNPLIGAKIATILFGSLLIVTFYWLLRTLKVRWTFIFSLILLFINPFTFRISLAKAPAVSILISLIAINLIFNYRYKLLFLLSFLYVWFYGGFIIVLIFTTLFILVNLVVNKWFKKIDHHNFLEKILSTLGRKFRFRTKKRINLKLFLSCLLGLLAGIIINPYFSQNLTFYYHQLIKIGIINYQKIIGVGGEWYPYGFIDLISNTVLVSILVVVSLVLFFINIKRQSKMSISLLFIYLLFFAFTLKSRRYVEYYVPYGILFAAVSLNDSLREFSIKKAFNLLRRIYYKSLGAKVLLTIILIYILVSLPTIVFRDLKTEKNDLNNGIPLLKFYNSSNWLKTNSPQGSIVIHSDWDDFPILFYYNDHNYYVVGLDPTFMFEYNKDLYWKWADLTTGKEVLNLHEVLKNEFNASYLIIEKDHLGMDRQVSSNINFNLVYEDKEAKIYQVK
jgi:hypothetical protein